jgi:hypothetical protein
MRRLTRIVMPLLAAVLALALLPPAGASATPVSAVTLAYEQHNASLPPCEFSAATLAAALRAQAPDQAEYDETFTLAIQAALTAQAAGHCAHHAAASGTPAATHPTGGSPPASVTDSTSAGPPAPLLALGGLALVLVLAAGTAMLLRLGAWEPLWLADWRQACDEAGYRLGLVRAELADRFGRHGRGSPPPPLSSPGP